MNSVCGIVVTFNPDASVVGNLEQLFPQLGRLVVVDNGSRPDTLCPIREAAKRLGFDLIEIGNNLGIAAALNRGVERARALQASWVALFDQDSTPEPRLISTLVDAYKSAPDHQRVAIVSPMHLKRETKTWLKPFLAEDGGLLYTITSGSLMPMSIFDACGPFEEDFIIDCVDAEHCLRVRAYGYTIIFCKEATLWVTLGSPRPFRFFGKTLFRVTHYSPGRRYYNTRNRLVIVKRYWRDYPRWCYFAVTGLIKELLVILIAENQKPAKFKNVALGICDAFRNRMGMVVTL